MRWIKCLLPVFLLTLAGCVTPPKPLDTSAFKAEAPRSILVLPPINHSVEVDAPSYFLSTISYPLAERGYYVYPVNTIKMVMEGEGISEPSEMHQIPPTKLGSMFGADAILYVTINKWDSEYVVLQTTTVVEFEYTIKSAKSGEMLWHTVKKMQYTPNNSQSGGDPLVSLISMAVSAAIERAAPNYMPLTKQANSQVFYGPSTAIPTGPYASRSKKL